MDDPMNPQGLRAVLSLARNMREAAASTIDLRYVGLFLAAAAALDDRASQLMSGQPDTQAAGARHAASSVAGSLMC
jgi:hypothetical protein